MAEFAVIIPARLKSSRFPKKPLAMIAGKPMIERVWLRCTELIDREQVFVATDHEEIGMVAEAFGANVIYTSDTCPTGTDRVAEAAENLDVDFIVNVQGDEPLLDPQSILTVVEAFRNGGGRVVNAVCPIESEDEYFSKSVPKVVTDLSNKLLYMSRGPVPSNKSGEFVTARKQICIYAFTKDQLGFFKSRDGKSPLEEVEDIEILRFLENGIEVQMVDVSGGSVAVDHPEDVAIVERILAE